MMIMMMMMNKAKVNNDALTHFFPRFAPAALFTVLIGLLDFLCSLQLVRAIVLVL